ncbi:MAG TPA: hypothetical protein PKY87_16830 [Terricaulis sp.]|nr:hypothetical protein [Terricaulis sp.]
MLLFVVTGDKSMSRLLLALRNYNRPGQALHDDEAELVNAQTERLAEARANLEAALNDPAPAPSEEGA